MARTRGRAWILGWLWLPPVEQSRERVFAITAWLALAFTSFSAVLAAGSSLVVLAGLNFVAVLFSAVTLRRLRRGDQPEPLVRTFLWFFSFMVSLGALATTPMEPTMFGYLFAMPLVAATMLEGSETQRWFMRAVVLGSVFTLAGRAGLVVAQVDPFPVGNQVFNFVAALVSCMALVQALGRDRDRSEECLREAERTKSAFFANMGHEIRTPMNGVLGMTDALLMRPLGDEEREMAQTIRSSGGLMLTLIDDLLDLSKLEAGRLVLHEAPVGLEALAAELRALWTPLAAKKKLEFTVVLDAALPKAALLDGVRLRQILGNLINNALKFTEAGHVTVTLAAHDGALQCTVEDTGIGITPEQQQRLFTRFSQADDARARRFQGTGLGLALSRELATHLGGTLVVQSTPGAGSRFTCTLPLVEAPLPVQAPPSARELPPGLRVLVVDDNAINRLVAQRLLDRSGCQVEVAVDGQQALEVLEAHPFDVVLMDVHMPHLDGLEVARRVRAKGGRGPRIIGVSASAESSDVASCREAGMDDFLSKPVTRERLLEALLRQA